MNNKYGKNFEVMPRFNLVSGRPKISCSKGTNLTNPDMKIFGKTKFITVNKLGSNPRFWIGKLYPRKKLLQFRPLNYTLGMSDRWVQFGLFHQI